MKVAIEVFLGVFLIVGFWRGFNWPVIFAVVALMALGVLHQNLQEFLPEPIRTENQVDDSKVQKLQQEINDLRDRLSTLSIAVGFKKPESKK